MAANEVDGGDRAAWRVLVQVTGASQPGGEFGQHRGLAAPEVTDRVPVFAVPFSPQRREVPDLIPALAHIPRLGDKLDLRHDRVLLDHVEKRRQPVHLMQFARERGSKSNRKPSTCISRTQYRRESITSSRTCGWRMLQAVPVAAVVEVVALGRRRAAGSKRRCRCRGRQCRPEMVALGRMIVHDVEDHFDARPCAGP